MVVDVWATWCGPCQEPMARLQTYGDAHPEWKDKVILISVSIDDEMNTAKQHLKKRGWTKSVNTWVSGAWGSAAIKAYRVRGIPTCYVIGVDGKIAGAEHPGAMRLADVVNGALAQAKK